MNTRIRNIYIFVAGFVVLIALGYYIDYQALGNTRSIDFKPSFKESHLNGNKTERLDSITKIYSNYLCRFSIDFPNNWNINRGVSEHTVNRAFQEDSAISFAVNVIEVDVNQSDIGIWTLWDNKRLGLEDNYRDVFPKMVNSDIFNFQSRKVYLSNREVVEIKCNYELRNIDAEYEIFLFYSVIRAPFSFTIGLHIPKFLYDENPFCFDHLGNKFTFLKTSDKDTPHT